MGTLCDLAANCVSSQQAQFWFGRFFSSSLQGTMTIFVHGAASEDGASARVIKSILRHCHREFTLELLERVLMFAEAWSSNVPVDKPFAIRWFLGVEALLQGSDDVSAIALTP